MRPSYPPPHQFKFYITIVCISPGYYSCSKRMEDIFWAGANTLGAQGSLGGFDFVQCPGLICLAAH